MGAAQGQQHQRDPRGTFQSKTDFLLLWARRTWARPRVALGRGVGCPVRLRLARGSSFLDAGEKQGLDLGQKQFQGAASRGRLQSGPWQVQKP